jgi:hypothetical protein
MSRSTERSRLQTKRAPRRSHAPGVTFSAARSPSSSAPGTASAVPTSARRTVSTVASSTSAATRVSGGNMPRRNCPDEAPALARTPRRDPRRRRAPEQREAKSPNRRPALRPRPATQRPRPEGRQGQHQRREDRHRARVIEAPGALPACARRGSRERPGARCRTDRGGRHEAVGVVEPTEDRSALLALPDGHERALTMRTSSGCSARTPRSWRWRRSARAASTAAGAAGAPGGWRGSASTRRCPPRGDRPTPRRRRPGRAARRSPRRRAARRTPAARRRSTGSKPRWSSRYRGIT